MERESKRVWWIVGAVMLLLVALRWAPAVKQRIGPRPRAAFVAVEFGDQPPSDGRFEIAAGTPFRLRAVLEAETFTGETVYFTEASALRLGGVEIPAERLRRWPGDLVARVRWFTVEGFAPFLEVSTPEDLERFRLNENFQPGWGEGWSVEGRIDPKNVQLDADSPLRPLPFGSQRYAVRIELFDGDEALTPRARAGSAGANAELARPGTVTGVVATLPPPLAVLSRLYGLTEIELTSAAGGSPGSGAAAPPADSALDSARRRWIEGGLAFDRRGALRGHLEAAGTEAGQLRWREIELAASGLTWGRELLPGDLLQAGGRIVVLYADAGTAGVLDPADLCLDFGRGAKIYRLDQLFRAASGATVAWAALPRSG